MKADKKTIRTQVCQQLNAVCTQQFVKDFMAANKLRIDENAYIPKATLRKLLLNHISKQSEDTIPLITPDMVDLLVLCLFDTVSFTTITQEEGREDCFLGIGVDHKGPDLVFMAPAELYREEARVSIDAAWVQKDLGGHRKLTENIAETRIFQKAA